MLLMETPNDLVVAVRNFFPDFLHYIDWGLNAIAIALAVIGIFTETLQVISLFIIVTIALAIFSYVIGSTANDLVGQTIVTDGLLLAAAASVPFFEDKHKLLGVSVAAVTIGVCLDRMHYAQLSSPISTLGVICFGFWLLLSRL